MPDTPPNDAETLPDRAPDAPESYRAAAEARLAAGQDLAAELVLAEGLLRLGPELSLALRFADLAAARRDFKAAVRRYGALLRHLPNEPAALRGLADVAERIRAQAAPPAPSPALPQAVPPPPPPRPEELGRLLLGFEPLGEDLTFGLVQRAAGLEPLGLLRFAVLHLDTLVRMLDADFAGLGAPETMQLLVRDQQEYVLRETRYGMLVHTFKAPGTEPAEAVADAGWRRMQFLARRLLDELKAPTRIFLRTAKNGEPPERILLLSRALRRHGPAMLLFVEQSDDAARIGRAEWLAPNVLRGAVSKLGWGEMALPDWLALCAHARAMADSATA